MNSDQIDILIELSDEQLEIVSGGDKKAPPPPIHDIHFTKVVDKASLN
jgi:hypothetical protein